MGGLYLYFVSHYLTYYYFDWVKYGAKEYAVAQKDLMNFLKERPSDTMVVEGVDSVTLLHYGFYVTTEPEKIINIYADEQVTMGNTRFLVSCEKPVDLSKLHGEIRVVSPKCIKPYNTLITSGSAPNAKQVIRSPEGEDEWYVFQF